MEEGKLKKGLPCGCYGDERSLAQDGRQAGTIRGGGEGSISAERRQGPIRAGKIGKKKGN